MGQFNHPGDLALDSKGKFVYVADLENNRVQKFDTKGNFIDEWGSLGKGDGQFNHPGDITFGENDSVLYISDVANHRVQKFDSNGTFLLDWGSGGLVTVSSIVLRE